MFIHLFILLLVLVVAFTYISLSTVNLYQFYVYDLSSLVFGHKTFTVVNMASLGSIFTQMDTMCVGMLIVKVPEEALQVLIHQNNS